MGGGREAGASERADIASDDTMDQLKNRFGTFSSNGLTAMNHPDRLLRWNAVSGFGRAIVLVAPLFVAGCSARNGHCRPTQFQDAGINIELPAAVQAQKSNLIIVVTSSGDYFPTVVRQQSDVVKLLERMGKDYRILAIYSEELGECPKSQSRAIIRFAGEWNDVVFDRIARSKI